MTTSNFAPDTKPTLAQLERLNEECFCITLDRDGLFRALELKAGDPQIFSALMNARPHLFSNSPVFLSKSNLAEMLQIIHAIEEAARLPGYREAALSWAPESALRDYGPLGALMGYDFHLTTDGPKLIEINTNAGGAFLNALLVDAQRACCSNTDAALFRSQGANFDSSITAMFQNEWRLQRKGVGVLRRIAIVDDRPEEQYLYPEFILAQRLLQKEGIESVIADPAYLQYKRGQLFFADQIVDLVYNRLVDFSLGLPVHNDLRAAYLDDAVVVTPNPHVHAIFADKRNMTLLSDQGLLASWGLSPQMVAYLAQVPRTVLVTSAIAPHLWQTRKNLFFKPAGGHGGKAVYRGDKLTKGVWDEILRGTYVAQDFAAPAERMVKVDGTPVARKTDIRLYVYNGELLLAAARLYQGQTTNFRTPGGGFAPVFFTEPNPELDEHDIEH
ncbi:MAG: hypothetical protein V4559_11100 [Pseudomonadota bacterium]